MGKGLIPKLSHTQKQKPITNVHKYTLTYILTYIHNIHTCIHTYISYINAHAHARTHTCARARTNTLGYAVVQSAEALCYKPEGCRFYSRCGHWNFLFTWSFRPTYGSGVDQASSRIEYHGFLLEGKGGRCVGLTTLPPSCADCLEMRAASTSWNRKCV